MKNLIVLIILFSSFCVNVKGQVLTDVVTNGSFEMPINNGRPAYWHIGFNDTPDSYQGVGNWELDSTVATDGNKSLKLSPNVPNIPGLDFIQYSFTQILDVPTYNLTGKTVVVEVDMMQDSSLQEAPKVTVFALNPANTSNITPQLPIGNEGYVVLTADSAQKNVFIHYTDSFVASGNALALVAIVTAPKINGSAWFDKLTVRVVTDTTNPPLVTIPPSPVSDRCYQMGLIANDNYNLSEPASEEMFMKMSNNAEIYNAFFAVRWTDFTNETITDGFKTELAKVQLAKDHGMDIALTFDFTHTPRTPTDTIGRINHVPNSDSIVGTFINPAVANAYRNELLQLCSLIQPDYVFVGIETNIFYETYNSQIEWDAFVNLYKEIADTMQILYSGIHTSTYFALNWIETPDGIIDTTNVNIWKDFLPQLPSVAFSVYPNTFNEKDSTYVSGYFSNASKIIPGLPLVISEFGVPGSQDTLTPFNYTQQEQMLTRIFQELDTVDVSLVCYYSMYDQTFYPSNSILDEFRRIGLHQQNGQEKPVFGLWEAVYTTNCSVSSLADNITLSEMNIYPNPFKENLTLLTPERIRNHPVEVRIYDLHGKLIYALSSSGNDNVQLDLKNLKKGIYFVQLVSEKDNLIFNTKIIKQ